MLYLLLHVRQKRPWQRKETNLCFHNEGTIPGTAKGRVTIVNHFIELYDLLIGNVTNILGLHREMLRSYFGRYANGYWASNILE